MDFNISQIDGVNGVVFYYSSAAPTPNNIIHGNFYCDGISAIAISYLNISNNVGFINIFQGGQSKYAPTIELGPSLVGNSSYIFSDEKIAFGANLQVTDINNDGCDDIAIGAPYSNVGDFNNSGSVFYIYGSSNLKGNINVKDLVNGMKGFVINGENLNDQFGMAGPSNSKGDINGDGLIDSIIATSSTINKPLIYLVPGTKGNTYPSNFNSSQIIKFGGSVFDLGISNSFLPIGIDVGKFDNDAFYDLIIGAPQNNNDQGQAFIYQGRVNIPSIVYLTEETTNVTVISGNGNSGMSLGGAVDNLNDLNNDGIDEFSITVSESSCRSGSKSLVFYSSIQGLPQSITYIDGATNLPVPGFILLNDITCNDYFNTASTDLNNDGKKDIIKVNDEEITTQVLFNLPTQGTLVLDSSCNNNLCIIFDTVKSSYLDGAIGGFDFNADEIEDFCFTDYNLGKVNCLFGSPTWPNAPLPGAVAPTLEDLA